MILITIIILNLNKQSLIILLKNINKYWNILIYKIYLLILQLRLIIYRFIEIYPGIVSLLNIKVYKGFIEFLKRNIKK